MRLEVVEKTFNLTPYKNSLLLCFSRQTVDFTIETSLLGFKPLPRGKIAVDANYYNMRAGVYWDRRIEIESI